MSMKRYCWVLSLLAIAAGFGGCERAPIPPGTEPTRESAARSPSLKDELPNNLQEAPQAVEGESYRLILHRMETEEGRAGDVKLALSLEGRGRWKVNEEFPIALTLKAEPPIELSARSVDKEGAVRFEEEGARFEFTARGGEGLVNASLRFAMCVPESCTFHNETLGIRLASR